MSSDLFEATYVQRIVKRIVLVDGAELARLMVQKGVGTDSAVYDLTSSTRTTSPNEPHRLCGLRKVASISGQCSD